MRQVRIGNGCGFWGDSPDAPIELAQRGELDYLTLEYLAELTMSILAAQQQHRPTMGYARDFLDVLAQLTPILHQQPQLKIITNAGGMNPIACAERARMILHQAGLTRRIGVVMGDSLLPQLDERIHEMNHLDTGDSLVPLRDRVVSANAYLGARPIVECLQQGADIIITGRVADASLTLAPAVHEFGWSWNDDDRLAAGSVAGHLIECGAQVTGGLWMNWRDADLRDIGYPIAIVSEDGTIEITKPPHTGGVVNIETVIEQLLYEVCDPSHYLTPDVSVDFTSLRLKQVADDRVRLTHARGHAPPTNYKVSAAYRDGFTAAGTLVIAGPDAVQKANGCAEWIFTRLNRRGWNYAHQQIEVLGAGAIEPTVNDRAKCDAPEVVLRIAVSDPSREAVERFTREFAPLVTSGPPGVTGYTSGRPNVREVLAYWPTLIAKSHVQPVALLC